MKKMNEREDNLSDFLMFPSLTLKEIEEKKDVIEEWLQDPNILQKINNTLGIRIVGEENLRMLLFLCGFSVFHRYKMSAIVQGAAATGKSYICRNVLKFFPNVIHFSRMTPAFLDRLRMNIDNYIFYVYELLASQEATGQLRLVLSEGELRLATVVGHGPNNVETRIISTKGTPVYITTTIRNIVEDQLGSRCWLVNTNESEEQTKKVVNHIALRHSTPDWDSWKEEEIQLRYLVNFFSYFRVSKVLGYEDFDDILIPYAVELATLFGMKEERMRRDYERLLNLIKTVTLLHYKQRPIIELPNGTKKLLSTLDDCKNALKIAEPFMTMTFLGLHTKSIEIYKQLKEIFEESEFTTREAAEALNLSMNRTRELLIPLFKKGFLNRDESSKVHRYSFTKKEMPKNGTILKILESSDFFNEEKLKSWLSGIGGVIRSETKAKESQENEEFKNSTALFRTYYPGKPKEAQIEAFKPEEAQKFSEIENRATAEDNNKFFYCERCNSTFLTIQDFSEHMKWCLKTKPI